MKRTIMLACLIASAELFAAMPQVEGVVAHQRWPFGTIVDIEFMVSAGEDCDLDVMATWEGQDESRRIGTYFNPGPGLIRMEWDPADVGLADRKLKNFSVSVKPVSVDEHLYLTVDFTQKQMNFSSVAPENSWNTRQNCMPFRRVRSRHQDGTLVVYTNGYDAATSEIELPNGPTATTLKKRNRTPFHTVTYSSDYFIALYPLTYGQATHMGLADASFIGANMFCKHNYLQFRGNTNGTDNIVWPTTGFKVAEDCDLARIRKYMRPFVRNCPIDFPTKSQWETAARAGESGDHIFALAQATKDAGFAPISAQNCDTAMMTNLCDQIAVWSHNNQELGNNDNVGRCAPNAWGLYDTAGLVSEPTLGVSAWGTTGTYTGMDPIGSPTPVAGAVNYFLMGGSSRDQATILSMVPGEGFGGAFGSTSLAPRLVINTRDWMAGR